MHLGSRIGHGCKHGVFSSWCTSGEAPVDPGAPGAQAQVANTILFLPRAVVWRLPPTLGTACSRWSPASPWPPRAASGPPALNADHSFPAQTVSCRPPGRRALRQRTTGHCGRAPELWPQNGRVAPLNLHGPPPHRPSTQPADAEEPKPDSSVVKMAAPRTPNPPWKLPLLRVSPG